VRVVKIFGEVLADVLSVLDTYFWNKPILTFLVLAPNFFGHLAQPSCNCALRIVKLLIRQCLHRGPLHERRQKVLKAFPADIRRIQSKFGLNPTLTTCPKYPYTHVPQPTQNPYVLSRPTRCQYPGRYERSRPYNELTTHGVQDEQSIRLSIHPFVYQRLPAFVAGLLKRPDMEDIVDRAWERVGKWTGDRKLMNICHGKGPQGIEGVGDNPLSDGPVDEALSVRTPVDRFNPYQNKRSSKAASTASTVMDCSNLLPRGPRYELVVFGPREEHTNKFNDFLRPLLDELLLMNFVMKWDGVYM